MNRQQLRDLIGSYDPGLVAIDEAFYALVELLTLKGVLSDLEVEALIRQAAENTPSRAYYNHTVDR